MQTTRMACAAFTLMGLIASPSTAGEPPDPTPDDFYEAIDQYLDCCEDVERDTPPPRLSDDVETIQAATFAFADAIRTARKSAKAGDILTLDVGVYLRRVIERGMKRAGLRTSDLFDDGDHMSASALVDLNVNDDFPWEWGMATPPILDDVLPPLPESLEFRLVGTSLVLVDVDAELIVDVLSNALPFQSRIPVVEV